MNSDRIKKSIELGDWISTQYEALLVSGNGRAELAATCYYITCQHQKAIAHLCCLGLFAPATALIRCAWDSFTRGMWLNFSATTLQLDTFKTKGKLPRTKDLLKAVDKAISSPGNSFVQAHEAKYNRLCDFTHTGIGQVSNHFIKNEIVSQLTDQSMPIRLVANQASGCLHFPL
jgi:hypothetical protein